MNPLRSKLEQSLGWIVLLALLAGCLLVLRPFVSALLWAVVLCFSCWPVYRRLLGLVRNRRTLAAFLMTLAMVLIVLLPFVLIGATLADNINQLTSAAKTFIQNGPPGPPDWLARVPVVGQRATDYWQGLTADTATLWTQTQQFIKPVSTWLLQRRPGVGRRPPATGVKHLHRVLPLSRRCGRRRASDHGGGSLGRGKRQAPADCGRPDHSRRGLWHPRHRPGAGGHDRYRPVHRRRARGRLADVADLFCLHPAGGGDRAGLDSRGALAFLSRVNRLGHLHARLGRGRGQPRQHHQAVAYQSGKRTCRSS